MSEGVIEEEFSREELSSQTYSQDTEKEEEMLEAFTFFDKDGDGFISTKEVATVMRALGQVPNVCEETDIVAEFAIEDCNEIDFKTFRKWVKTKMKSFDEDSELRESFRRFDKEELGMIEIEALKTMLTTLGESLTVEEADSWLADAEEFIENGYLKYEDFATMMLSK